MDFFGIFYIFMCISSIHGQGEPPTSGGPPPPPAVFDLDINRVLSEALASSPDLLVTDTSGTPVETSLPTKSNTAAIENVVDPLKKDKTTSLSAAEVIPPKPPRNEPAAESLLIPNNQDPSLLTEVNIQDATKALRDFMRDSGSVEATLGLSQPGSGPAKNLMAGSADVRVSKTSIRSQTNKAGKSKESVGGKSTATSPESVDQSVIADLASGSPLSKVGVSSTKSATLTRRTTLSSGPSNALIFSDQILPNENSPSASVASLQLRSDTSKSSKQNASKRKTANTNSAFVSSVKSTKQRDVKPTTTENIGDIGGSASTNIEPVNPPTSINAGAIEIKLPTTGGSSKVGNQPKIINSRNSVILAELIKLNRIEGQDLSTRGSITKGQGLQPQVGSLGSTAEGESVAVILGGTGSAASTLSNKLTSTATSTGSKITSGRESIPKTEPPKFEPSAPMFAIPPPPEQTVFETSVSSSSASSVPQQGTGNRPTAVPDLPKQLLKPHSECSRKFKHEHNDRRYYEHAHGHKEPYERLCPSGTVFDENQGCTCVFTPVSARQACTPKLRTNFQYGVKDTSPNDLFADLDTRNTNVSNGFMCFNRSQGFDIEHFNSNPFLRPFSFSIKFFTPDEYHSDPYPIASNCDETGTDPSFSIVLDERPPPTKFQRSVPPQKLTVFINTTESGVHKSIFEVKLGKLHTVDIVYNKFGFDVTVNKKSMNINSVKGNLQSRNAPLTLGQCGKYGFKGCIKDLVIYNKCLPETL